MATSAAPGTWKVTNTTVKIKVGATSAMLRVYNDGPQSVIIKNGKTRLVLLRPQMACDVEGTNISVTGPDSTGKYDRL